ALAGGSSIYLICQQAADRRQAACMTPGMWVCSGADGHHHVDNQGRSRAGPMFGPHGEPDGLRTQVTQ
ncbi:MAG: hypothetical protein V3S01_09715, partial [Dehalococcoidia bacterium]